MKRFIFAIVGIVVIGIAWRSGNSFGYKTDVVRLVPTPTPAVTIITSPITLEIPRLNINTHIEHVGLDSEMRMDVPKEDMNVAWYQLGAKVGEKGSAVIAGHFDTMHGTPAVFYGINKLQPGDKIKVTGEEGKNAVFVVTETKTVEDASFPIQEVFARNDTVRLNLITCAGAYDTASHNYKDRFIVYSVLTNK